MSDIFDPSAVDENTFPVAPPGTYRALVEHAEIKPTKAGTGRYVQVNMSLVDHPHKGIRVMAFLNFENQNQTAQNIGRAQLKKFLASFGAVTAIDLKNIGMLAKNKVISVVLDIEDGQRGPQNRVEEFLPMASGRTPTTSVISPGRIDAVRGLDTVPF